jgi:hypothetical protein
MRWYGPTDTSVELERAPDTSISFLLAEIGRHGEK